MVEATGAAGGGRVTHRGSPGITLWLLALASLAYALQQTLVVPALPLLGRDLHTSTTWVTWVFTGFLLSSAVLTPLVGKLGDTYGKKLLLVISLAGFAAGTVVCAVAGSITLLIAGRIIQGVGGAILPLAFGIVRDELPRERVGVGLGLISAMLGVGAGFGLVMSGLILDAMSWPWLFWIGTAPIVVALVLVWWLVPESPVRTPSRLDWRGALSLSAGLVALLLALSEGQSWGWLSATTLGVFAASVVILLLWVWIELRVPQPMVQIGMMRERTVFWTNVAAVLAGFALYGTYLLVPTFVQMPRGLPPALASLVDYGFGASVVAAGLFLFPASVVMLIVGPVGGIVERRLGARAVNLAGLVVLALGAVFLALLHAEKWEIVVAMALIGCGVGTVYAMLAKLIVDAVEPAVTGVAIGMNTVMRTIGGVIGGQIGAALLSSITIAGTGGAVPAEGAFTWTFWVSAGAGLLGAVGMTMVPRPKRRPAGPVPAAPALPPEAVAGQLAENGGHGPAPAIDGPAIVRRHRLDSDDLEPGGLSLAAVGRELDGDIARLLAMGRLTADGSAAGTPVALQTRVDNLVPLEPGDVVDSCSAVTSSGRTSFEVTHAIVRGDALAAVATRVYAWTDAQGAAAAVPAWLRALEVPVPALPFAADPNGRGPRQA